MTNITFHIKIAIAIFVLGLVIGVLLFLCNDPKYNSMTATVIMSFLAFAFSYLQFYLNKYETEKRDFEYHKQVEERTEYDKNKEKIRRMNNLKLIAYKDIMTILDNLVLSINNQFGEKINSSIKKDTHYNIRNASNFLSIQFSYNSLFNRVKYYEELLVTDIWSSEFDKLLIIIEDLYNVDLGFEKYTLNMLECKSKIDEHIFTTLITENPDSFFNFSLRFF